MKMSKTYCGVRKASASGSAKEDLCPKRAKKKESRTVSVMIWQAGSEIKLFRIFNNVKKKRSTAVQRWDPVPIVLITNPSICFWELKD